MTLDVRSFLAGAAGVLGILAVGFGGGVMLSGALSDGPREPNKVERQAAKETKPLVVEAKPENPQVITAPPAPVAAAQVQLPAEMPAPVPKPEPVVQAQPAPQISPAPPQVIQALPPPLPQQVPQRSQVTVHSLGPEKAVALTQSVEERSSRATRREAARLKVQQRREERAQRREERRREVADRRQREQLRREDMRSSAQRLRLQDADDDDDEPPIVTRQERRNDFPFFRTWER